MKKIYLMIFVFVLFLLAGCGSKVNIEFVTNGGTPVEAITKEADFDLNNLPSTTKEGFEFWGWFLDEECTISLGKEQPKNLEFKLYAKWIPIKYDYKVEYYNEKLDGGYQLVYSYNLKGNFNEVVNAEITPYLGFTFNESKSNKTTTIKETENETLKMYYDRNSYKVFIDEDGGTPVDDLTLKYGELVVLPTVTRIGYEFASWDTNPTVMPEHDLTFKAQWTPLEVDYKIEVYEENADDDGFTLVSQETKKALSGSTVEFEEINSTGRPFVLFTDHPDSNIKDVVNGDGSTILEVYYKRRLIDVEFNFYEGKDPIVKKYKYGASNYIIAAGERVGHEFLYWSDSTSASPSPTVPNDGLQGYKLFANWKKLSYTITFETNANIAVTSITALYDSPITAPTNPVRQGYNFLGWYKDQNYTESYTFGKMEARNFTLYAKWEGLQYTMEFDSNGGSLVEPITAIIDSNITKPIPTKDGYELVNWYTDSNLTQVFSDWKMPYNGIKLYAKWIELTYTITFNTNGGSPLEDIRGYYLQYVMAPVNNPVKPGFIFDGYYKDAEFLEEFIFETMPLNGATVYVKWIDESLATSIANVLRQDIGSEVKVKGYVYAFLNSDYYGYYLYDDTGYIYIHAPNTNITIGDYVSISGNLSLEARLVNVTDEVVETSNNSIKNPTRVSLDALYNLEFKLNNYYKYCNATGVLQKINDKYVLFDYLTENEMIIDHRSANYASLDQFVNNYVSVDFAYDIVNYRLIMTDIEKVEDDQEGLSFLKTLIDLKFDYARYDSNANFELPTSDNFGIGATLSYVASGENASYYDAVNNKFNEVEGNVLVTFTLTLNVGTLQEVFDINIIVGNVDTITVSEFYANLPNTTYLLDVVVIMVFGYEGYAAVVKDDTGYLLVDGLRELRIGDHIILEAMKSIYEEYMYYDARVVEVIEREVDLELNPSTLTPEEFNATVLDFDFGEYVELTGYIEYIDDLYNDGFKFTCGEQEYDIYTFIYQDIFNLRKYSGYLVKFKTYVLNTGPDTYLLYSGVRGDIEYPEYTDQEAVNAIQTIFTRLYSGRTFSPFDTIDLPTKDLVYGVDIAYELTPTSLPYYVDGKFKYVDEAVSISIDFTLTKNAVTQNFTYNTTLEPFPITSSNELPNIEDYNLVYVKGLVVYRNINYLIIKDEYGYIRYDDYDTPIYAGDYVVLRGHKYTYNEEIVLDKAEDFDVVEIISRGNEVGYLPEAMTLADIYNIDLDEDYNLSKFVTISGQIKKDGGWFYLTDGVRSIRLDAVDDYSWYKLETMVESLATITAYLGYYSNDIWYVYYLGDQLSAVQLTDSEKMARIKDYINGNYDGSEENEDSYMPLVKSFPLLNGTVVYSSVSPELIIESGNIYTKIIEADTVVTITATITVGELTESINFNVTLINYVQTNPTQTIPISEIFNMDENSTVRINGKVLADFYAESTSYYLVRDDSGVIYVELPSTYIYYSHVGRIVEIYGNKAEANGRIYFKASLVYNNGTTTVSETFEQLSFADVYNLNHYEQANFGKAIEITGKIIDGEYITDGFDNYRILAQTYNREILRNHNGCNVTLRGFYYGNPIYYSNEIMIVFANYYAYEPVISLGINSDTEKVAKGKMDLINNFMYAEYTSVLPSSTYSLPANNNKFIDCIYSYSVLGDTGAFISDGTLNFTDLHRDYKVTIRVDITCGTASDYLDITFSVTGYEINTLDELFLDEPGTKKINLIGKVLLASENYLYFLINGDVYYLEKEDYYQIEIGDICLIKGQKSNIDGEINYSYRIEVMTTEGIVEEEVNIVPKTITEIYTDNSLGLDLRKDAYLISGTIKYDENSGYFYIDDSNNRIYLRHYVPEYYPTSVELMGKEFYIPEFVNELVDCVVLYPNRYIYGGYILVDLYDISLQELTPEENIDNAVLDIKENLEGRVFYTDEFFLYEFYPKNPHYLNVSIAIKDLSKENYFCLDFERVGIVDEESFIAFDVTVTDGTLTRTFEQIVHLMPIETSTIHDVLYGVTDEYYIIEGTVQAYHYEYYLILKDATGTIFVNMNFTYTYPFTINIGDKLKIYGSREYYNDRNITPIIRCFGILKPSGSGDVVNNNATVFDTDSIYDINYTEPKEYTKYISFTGVVVFTGNTWYPSYGIVDENMNMNYKIELIGQTYTPFNDMMSELIGRTITIKGWLVLNSTYTRYEWEILYDSHIVHN